MYNKRVNISLPEDLLAKMDEAAEALCLSRSAYISVAVSMKLQQDEMMKQLPYIVHKMQEQEAEAKRG